MNGHFVLALNHKMQTKKEKKERKDCVQEIILFCTQHYEIERKRGKRGCAKMVEVLIPRIN